MKMARSTCYENNFQMSQILVTILVFYTCTFTCTCITCFYTGKHSEYSLYKYDFKESYNFSTIVFLLHLINYKIYDTQ